MLFFDIKLLFKKTIYYVFIPIINNFGKFMLLILLSFLFLSLLPENIAISHFNFSPNLIYRYLNFFIFLYNSGLSIFVLIRNNDHIVTNKKYLGQIKYEKCLHYTNITSNKAQRIIDQNNKKLIITIFAVFSLLILLVYRNPNLVWVSSFLILIGVVQFARQRIPASIIVLGNSNNKSLKLHKNLILQPTVFRIISLLYIDSFKCMERFITAGDNFRVTDSSEWETIVYSFINCTGLVIIDLREITSYVEKEFDYIINNHYEYKTIFVLNSETPTLFPKINKYEKLLLISESQCVVLIRYILNNEKHCPNINYTAKQIFEKQQEKEIMEVNDIIKERSNPTYA